MNSDVGYFQEKPLGKPYDIKILKRLFPFARPYRPLFLGTIFLVVFITLLDLALPYVTKIAIDRYIVPPVASGVSSSTTAGENKIRYLQVDITDAGNRAIVHKHSDLFTISGTFARIHLQDLPRLDPKDIAVLRKSDLAGVGLAAAVFLALVIVNFGLNFAQEMILEYTGQKIMHDVRVRLFGHIQSLSVTFFARNPVGRLVTRVTNDVQNMHEFFTSVVAFVFKDLFLLAGITVVLLRIHWQLALLAFTVLPFVLCASMYFSRKARDAFRALRIKIAEINTRLSETIAGMKVIQLFRQEQENYRGFAKLNHEYYLAGMKQLEVFAVFMPTIELLGTVAVAMVILYGGTGALSGSISLGTLVAFISYLKMFFSPLRDIAEKYNIMQDAMSSAERIFLILDTHDKQSQGPVPALPSDSASGSQGLLSASAKITDIRMENVSFGYVPGELVLKEISFAVRAGETLAVVGPTGSGKTSLMNLMVRFYDPISGRIFINGRDIKALAPSVLRAKISLVMQDPFLFSESIRRNIEYGKPDISDEEMAYILEASNCQSFIAGLPQGLDTVLSEGGASISSGERQLISIARAFARDPDLIIFDEATSYIDSNTEHKIQKALYNLMKNRTAIVVAHRLSTARHADRIIVLNRGKIIETGSHQQLMNRKGFYFLLSQLQNSKDAAI